MRVKLAKFDCQGSALHYRVRGHGPYLLLIHGRGSALEMALGQPERVLRLALINSLCSYRTDSLRKWLKARLPLVLVRVIGMRRMAWAVATRLFPNPWQRPLRERAAAVISAAPASSYLSMALALERWKSSDGFASLKSKTLVIAAEHDCTPLPEKKAMAAALGAQFVVVRGSRHGTPFDSTEATNACLSAFLSDRPLPHPDRWVCDGPPVVEKLSLLAGITRSKSRVTDTLAAATSIRSPGIGTRTH